MTLEWFKVTHGPEDPDEPGWRLDFGEGEGTITFTPNIPSGLPAVSGVESTEQQ